MPRDVPKLQEIKKLDISEPILTIVSLLKEERDRFNITCGYDPNISYLPNYIIISVTDKINRREIMIAKGIKSNILIGMSWVTKDEEDLLIKTIIEIHDKEKEQALKDQDQLERSKWAQDYQKI